jgi:tetratricopeptide (TPR) repeat protein
MPRSRGFEASPFRFAPDRPVTLLLLAALALGGDPVPPVAAVVANEEGLEEMRRGRYEAAAERFRAAFAEDPAAEAPRRNLAAALDRVAGARLRSGAPEAALALWDEAVALHPGRIAYRSARAGARLALDRDADALYAREDLEWVLARDGDHRESLAALGGLSYRERRLEEAIRHWRRALELDPTDAALRAQLEAAEREWGVERSFEELRGNLFVVRHPPSIPRETAAEVMNLCLEAHGTLCPRFGFHPPKTTVVTLYSPREFRQATGAHAWVAGLSDGTIRIAAPDGGRAAALLRNTIFHEFAHHLIRGIVARAPRWLHEGLAQAAAGDAVEPAEARLRAAMPGDGSALDGAAARSGDGEGARAFYDLALSFSEFLRAQGGDVSLQSLLLALKDGRTEEEALRQVYGASRAELFERWGWRLRGS